MNTVQKTLGYFIYLVVLKLSSSLFQIRAVSNKLFKILSLRRNINIDKISKIIPSAHISQQLVRVQLIHSNNHHMVHWILISILYVLCLNSL